MSAPGVLVTLTPADVMRLADYREEELRSLAAKPASADEMIDVLFAEAYRVETSARAAVQIYGGWYDAGVVRRSAVIGKAAEFLELVNRHRDEVLPLLRGGGTVKRERRG